MGETDTHLNHRTSALAGVKEEVVERHCLENGKKLSTVYEHALGLGKSIHLKDKIV
jgi:hypothetical protein